MAGYKRLGVLSADLGDDVDLAAVMAAVFAPIMSSTMEDLNFGELFQQSLDMAEQLGEISAPKELALLGKQFLYFERYVKGIAPDYMIIGDPYLLKNIFPEEAAAKMAELAAGDPAFPVDPDAPSDVAPPVGLIAADGADSGTV